MRHSACVQGQQRANQGEHELRESLEGRAHRNRGNRIFRADTALNQMADHKQGSTDLSDRHHAVCGLAHPARQHGARPRTARRGCIEQHVDRCSVDDERQQVKQRDRQQAPFRCSQSCENGRHALRREHTGEQQHTRRQEPGRCPRHARSRADRGRFRARARKT